MANKRKYTDEQIEYVGNWFSVTDIATIAKRIGATEPAVRSLAKSLNVPSIPDDCISVYELSSMLGIHYPSCKHMLKKIDDFIHSQDIKKASVFTRKGDVRPMGWEIAMTLKEQDRLAIECGFKLLSSIRKKAGISSDLLSRWISGELTGKDGTKASLFTQYFITENIVGKKYAILLSELLKIDGSILQELGYDVSKASQEKEVIQTIETRIAKAVRLKIQQRQRLLSKESGD